MRDCRTTAIPWRRRGRRANTLGAALALAPLVDHRLIARAWRSARPLIAPAADLSRGCLYVFLLAALGKKFFPRFTCCRSELCTACLAVSFGRSLRRGATRLSARGWPTRCTVRLTPLEVRYTRPGNCRWALLFAAITAAVFILFVSAPLRVWSLFANFWIAASGGAHVRCRICRPAPRRTAGRSQGHPGGVQVFLASPRDVVTEPIPILSHGSPTAVVAYYRGRLH